MRANAFFVAKLLWFCTGSFRFLLVSQVFPFGGSCNIPDVLRSLPLCICQNSLAGGVQTGLCYCNNLVLAVRALAPVHAVKTGASAQAAELLRPFLAVTRGWLPCTLSTRSGGQFQ